MEDGGKVSYTSASTVIVIPLFCDCCGKQKLAEIRDNKLVIFDTRHGQRHFITVELAYLKKLTGMV